MVAKAKTFKLGAGTEDIDIAPLSYKELHERVNYLIGTAEKEGGRLVLDGRNYTHPQYPKGNFVGPTIIDNV